MEFEIDLPVLQLVRDACALGALNVGGPLSQAERLIARTAKQVLPATEDRASPLRARIRSGEDPLGARYLELKEKQARRRAGLFYTDPRIVEWMASWVLSHGPTRVVDAGCGSGRFACAITRTKAAIPIIAVDTDPIATLLCRANLAVVGAQNVSVLNEDFTALRLPAISGTTAFIGNPPYVRHHRLSPEQKDWVHTTSKQLGHVFSRLSGLHAHFFLATAMHGKPSDVGCYITSAEWLDTNYGAALRGLLLDGLGVQALHMFDHASVPFGDAMTTAIITCFTIGRTSKTVTIRTVEEPDDLKKPSGARHVPVDDLVATSRWGSLFRRHSVDIPDGFVRLGDIAQVHRGIVTGNNRFFVMSREQAEERGLKRFTVPVITSAEEVLRSEGVVSKSSIRNVVLALPKNLILDAQDAAQAVQYLQRGEAVGIPATYICSHRQPWWYLGLKPGPPVVATYMARQAPAFAFNPDRLPILNVLHGIYPKEKWTNEELRRWVERLNSARETFRRNGRFYHGGLQKLEPREMEGLLVPRLF